MEYLEFLEKKKIVDVPTGISTGHKIPDGAFPFQQDIISWALRRGRAAIFADCGMGKTLMQLAWADNIPGNVLILTPLAVAGQTVREGAKFGIEVQHCRHQSEVKSKIVVTNYEMMHHFDSSKFTAIVLDESSILKSYSGKFRNQIIEEFAKTPYRLACTATPAPNDYMELGNHSEFCGVMSRTEMLSMFFVHDGGETQKWRLKGHAEDPFWQWMCSWAVNIRNPSDLGYDNAGFSLPPMHIHQHTVKSNEPMDGFLFAMEAQTLQERQQARRESITDRVEECARVVAENPDRPWLIWCNMNNESEMLSKMIPGAVEVKGSDKTEFKESALAGFSSGDIRILVTKPSIAGFGMNWQHCADMAFVGLSDSYEQFYQALRRCWRFGQKNPVNVHVITSESEGAVVRNIQRKESDAIRMADEMVKHMAHISQENIRHAVKHSTKYQPGRDMILPNFLKGI